MIPHEKSYWLDVKTGSCPSLPKWELCALPKTFSLGIPQTILKQATGLVSFSHIWQSCQPRYFFFQRGVSLRITRQEFSYS